ncbi:MAG: hypothetical protein FP824_06170 [Euryarchaeota archaeon]|nr:hypothetical protein [Euryarchaeota archaeon]MBU4032943.1 hypothetical protein [Candidatus Thermoplasmatota archaeon]MBU4144243.1 hypothetical protein [Candidatus Thermoplasmatota archaeon]
MIVLNDRGWVAPGALAREIHTDIRTTEKHLGVLKSYRKKVDILHYYPNGKLYRITREKRFVTCHRCRAKVRVPYN